MSACIVCGAKDAPLAWPGTNLHLCEACDVEWSESYEAERAAVAERSIGAFTEKQRDDRIRSAIMDFVTRVKAEQANARKP